MRDTEKGLPPTDEWKIALHEKLLSEKIQRLESKERDRKLDLERNWNNYETEAERLLTEIVDYNPEDRWQYRKGLRLMYLGTQLGNEYYKSRGHEFFLLTCAREKS